MFRPFATATLIGDFDNPPASSSNNSESHRSISQSRESRRDFVSRSDRQQRFRHLRNNLRRERELNRAIVEVERQARQAIINPDTESPRHVEHQEDPQHHRASSLMTSPSRQNGIPASEGPADQNNPPPTEFPTSAIRTRPRPMPERISAVIRRRRRQQFVQQLYNESQAQQPQLHRQFQRQQQRRQIWNRPHSNSQRAGHSQSRRRMDMTSQDSAEDVATSALARVEETQERLADLSSRLTSLGELLDATNPYMSLSQTTNEYEASQAGARGNARDGQQHRSKRRKIKHGSNSQKQTKGIRYGHYGSVVPGQLKLEIVSCDGGEYANDCSPSYGVENVLKNDPSVYCTKSSRCNLMLRHQGEVPLCLEKLVIEAPKRGFTAPVQQGLIFLSMTSENLIRDTASQENRLPARAPSPPASSHASSSSPLNEQLTLLESLTDPEVAMRHEQNAAAAAAAAAGALPWSDWPFSFSTSNYSFPSSTQQSGYDNGASTSPNGDARGANDLQQCDWPLTEPGSQPSRTLAVTVSNDSGSDIDPDNDTSPDIVTRLRRHGNSGGGIGVRENLAGVEIDSDDGSQYNDDDDGEYGEDEGNDLTIAAADRSGHSHPRNENDRDRDAEYRWLEGDVLAMASELFPSPPNSGPPGTNIGSNNDYVDFDNHYESLSRRSNANANTSANANVDTNANVNNNTNADNNANTASTHASNSTHSRGNGTANGSAGAGSTERKKNPPIQPHARFSMALNRGKVTVKFDPPVSCKIILLKLWSPLRNGNIDIQSVTAHGFAGPRYFPACQLR